MVMIAFPFVTICLEYTWMFYVMLIASIIAILIDRKKNKNLNILFLITGIVTCFLDFLTTEIITLFVPMLFVLIIRKNENRLENFKEGIIFFIKSSIFWLIGYLGMWLSKWILASIILEIDVMDYVYEQAMHRVNGFQGFITVERMYKEVIFKNLHTLYPINSIKRKIELAYIAIAIGIYILIFTDWKNIKKMWFSGLLLIIALMPYLRYLVLANHSYFHHIFTFRSQMITIIALGWTLLETRRKRFVFFLRNKKVKEKKQMKKM